MAVSAIRRARALIGTPFRLHGRDEGGVDCVGLVALAFRQTGVPSGYALRTADTDAVAALLLALEFRKRRTMEPGDVLLFDAGPAQLHLGLWTGDSVVHADAALRRVVETPGPPRWPVLSIWRR